MFKLFNTFGHGHCLFDRGDEDGEGLLGDDRCVGFGSCLFRLLFSYDFAFPLEVWTLLMTLEPLQLREKRESTGGCGGGGTQIWVQIVNNVAFCLCQCSTLIGSLKFLNQIVNSSRISAKRSISAIAELMGLKSEIQIVNSLQPHL